MFITPDGHQIGEAGNMSGIMNVGQGVLTTALPNRIQDIFSGAVCSSCRIATGFRAGSFRRCRDRRKLMSTDPNRQRGENESSHYRSRFRAGRSIRGAG